MNRDGTLGYPDEQVEEGVVFKQSPLTGITYRVARWVEKNNGGIVALEKDPADEGDLRDAL